MEQTTSPQRPCEYRISHKIHYAHSGIGPATVTGAHPGPSARPDDRRQSACLRFASQAHSRSRRTTRHPRLSVTLHGRAPSVLAGATCARARYPSRSGARAPCRCVYRVLSAMCAGTAGAHSVLEFRMHGTSYGHARGILRTRRRAPSSAFVGRPDLERPERHARKGQGPEQLHAQGAGLEPTRSRDTPRTGFGDAQARLADVDARGLPDLRARATHRARAPTFKPERLARETTPAAAPAPQLCDAGLLGLPGAGARERQP